MKKKALIVASFLPLLLLMTVAYVLPMAQNIVGSVSDDAGNFVALQNYEDVLGSYYFWNSLGASLKVSFVSTLIAMVIAIVLALALRETFAGKKLALFISQYNLSIPHMAAAMMMVFLFSQTGGVSAIAHALGLIESATDFPVLIYDSGLVGVIVVFVWKFAPYICISVLGVLQGASREYEDQAASLGLGKVKRFTHIVLPSIMPATAVASILVFASAFGDYEVPAILGSTQARPLSVMIYTKYLDKVLRDRPEAYALMIIMAIILAIIIIAYWVAVNRQERQQK